MVSILDYPISISIMININISKIENSQITIFLKSEVQIINHLYNTMSLGMPDSNEKDTL